MVDREKFRTVIVFAPLAVSGSGCAGIPAGVDYPRDLPSLELHVASPEGESDPSIALGSFKFKDDLCKGIDTHIATRNLTQEDFTRFLEAQGVKNTAKQARADLYWYDFPNGDDDGFVRLRLALGDTSAHASKNLTDTLLDHGPGWWGIRRSNLAILAPKASLSEAVAFAIKYKLVCWGMFTYTGVDDAYVVPGPYMEL